MSTATVARGEPRGRYGRILRKHAASRDSLIPILQAVQESEGYVCGESIAAISDYLDLPESKIFGVATFYNQFRLSAPGRYQVQICRGTACHVKGSLNLLEVLQQELGIQAGETTRDGLFSLETVACLGACSIAPVMRVNGEFHGRLDKKAVVRALDEIRGREAEGGADSDAEAPGTTAAGTASDAEAGKGDVNA
jgi:NADH-quinone oxidoreductase subunit E